MPVCFSELHLAEPTPQARRLLWHVLSVGRVWRDEPEDHPGADKAGLHLFWVEKGRGWLVINGQSIAVRPGQACWLVDLRQPRSYLPASGQTLVTTGMRFHGPGLETWRETLAEKPEFPSLPNQEFTAIRRAQRRLLKLSSRRPAGWEWRVHETLNAVLGRLAQARDLFQASPQEPPPPVRRVLDAVLSAPERDWQAAELAQIAGVSYSLLRNLFKNSRKETLHTFLQRTRLDQARRLLGDSRLTVNEVADRLHFSSAFYFSHFFRRETGLSPTAFRREPRT